MTFKNSFGMRRMAKLVAVAGLVSAGAFLSAASASTFDVAADAQAQALSSWHETMRHMAIMASTMVQGYS